MPIVAPTLSSGMLERCLRNVHKTAFLMDDGDVGHENTNVTYSVVPKTQSDNIAQFLVRYYHQLEPITVALGEISANVTCRGFNSRIFKIGKMCL